MSEAMRDDVVVITSVYSDMLWSQLPTYLVWVIGLVLAWRRRRVHPQPYVTLCIALGGLLLYSLASPVIGALVAAWVHRREWDRSSVETMIKGLGFVDGLVMAILWGLVLAAALGWRRTHVDVHEGEGVQRA